MSSSSSSAGVLEKLEIAKTKKDAGDAAFKSGDVKAGQWHRVSVPGPGRVLTCSFRMSALRSYHEV